MSGIVLKKISLREIGRKKTSLRCVSFVLFAASVPTLLWGGARPHQKAVVVRVEKHEDVVPLNRFPPNAPLRPANYAYDISIRLECVVYVGRYQSATDYLPSVFAAGQPAEASVDKHTIYVRVPGTGEVKLTLIRRDNVPQDTCAAGKQ